MGWHSWEWRFTRFDPVGGHLQAVRIYRCERCNKPQERR
jgi:hypothetical protein